MLQLKYAHMFTSIRMSVVRCLIGIPGNMRFTDILINDFKLSRAEYGMLYYKRTTHTLTELICNKTFDCRKRVYVVKLDELECIMPHIVTRNMSTNLDRTSSYLIYVVHNYDNDMVGLSHFPIDMLVNFPDLLDPIMQVYIDDACYN